MPIGACRSTFVPPTADVSLTSLTPKRPGSRCAASTPPEVETAKTLLERTEERLGLRPERLAADTAYGSAPTLDWFVNERKIAPHIPVIDKSKREDGTFSREDFTFDKERDIYTCPADKILTTTQGRK